MMADHRKGSASHTRVALRVLQSIFVRLAAPVAVAAFLLVAGWHYYADSGLTVHLKVDGRAATLRTHAKTVQALLAQQGLALSPADSVWPAPESPLADGAEVQVDRARAVHIRADGRSLIAQTLAVTPDDILREAGIHIGPRDIVVIDGDTEPSLPGQIVSEQRVLSSRGNTDVREEPPRSIEVQRAIEVTVNDGGVPMVIYSTAQTVVEALWEAGLSVYVGDSVRPDAGSPLVAGMEIYIKRGVPLEIEVDSRLIRTRTQASSVGEVLAEEGVSLLGLDYAEPSLNAAIAQDMKIRVVRQRREFLVEQQPISYQTVWKADPALEIDQRRVQIPGQEGLQKRRIRVLIRDGVEVERKPLDEWLAVAPQDKVIAYGTQVIMRTLETPYGPVEYWRKVRMLATSYTAATSGKEPGHPTYGITRVGWAARKGIVAVDPTVVNLLTKVYVPGYGIADVGDTGGGIKGRRIDLCYDEGQLVLWYKWLDVYLLGPPPAANSIRYVLPDWPIEK